MKYLHDVVKHHKAQHVRTYGAAHACSRSIFSKEFEFIGSTQVRMEHYTHRVGQTP